MPSAPASAVTIACDILSRQPVTASIKAERVVE
jgi:hypothetical protein